MSRKIGSTPTKLELSLRLDATVRHPNRIVFALVQLSSGALEFGVKGWADGSPALGRSMPVEHPNPDAASWVFLAVTYDGTQPAANVDWYLGIGDQAA